MAEAVLDASAVLAYLHDEPGRERVEAVIARAALSAVNLAEIVTKLVARGMSADAAAETAWLLPCEIAELDADSAIRIGTLHAVTAARGLSLGDRACLALAEARRLPALTADRAWSELPLAIEVEQIRD